MADNYATTNPPVLVAQSISGPGVWFYSSVDVDADVDAANYFDNGSDLGMKVGDAVWVYDTAGVLTPMRVSAVTAGGAATVVAATVTV